jgi:hypothetical protein
VSEIERKLQVPPGSCAWKAQVAIGRQRRPGLRGLKAETATLGSTRLPLRAVNPALGPGGPLHLRDLFTDPRYEYLQAMVDARATTGASTDKFVTARGEVDTVRYGAVIDPGGLIDVRGAGESYDGRYRVDSVTHTISRGSHRQAFVLTLKGTGSTISSVRL